MFMPHTQYMCKLVNNYSKLKQENKQNKNPQLAT